MFGRHKKTAIIAALMVFISSPVYALDLYAGLGVIDEWSKLAERCEERKNPLAVIEVVQPLKNGWSIEYMHASSVHNVDADYGINMVFIKKKLY